nr:hypothetical protein GCM10020063_056240 [Dactylosporangium thailandense]
MPSAATPAASQNRLVKVESGSGPVPAEVMTAAARAVPHGAADGTGDVVDEFQRRHHHGLHECGTEDSHHERDQDSDPSGVRAFLHRRHDTL